MDIAQALVTLRPDLIVVLLPQITTLLAILTALVDSPEVATSMSRTMVNLFRRRGVMTAPMGKHAPSLLVAYSRSALGMSAATRSKMEPGLFNICDAMTVGGRSGGRGREGEGVGTPFGLENGPEREVWADIWQKWSKRRYTGQG